MPKRYKIEGLDVLPLFHIVGVSASHELRVMSCAHNVEEAAHMNGNRVRFVRWEAIAFILRRLYLQVCGRRLGLTSKDISLEAMYCGNATLIPFLACAGNRFDSEESAWRDPGVKTLASVIYDSMEWSILPILADRLEDAGCADLELLKYLRRGQKPINQFGHFVAMVGMA